MKLSRRSSLERVAACVSGALNRGGIRAVLCGGACASLYSRGAYQSSDLDFILQTAVSPGELDSIMRTIGFHRRGTHYEHPETSFFVEFPAGPLGIGADLHIQPVTYRVGRVKVPALSPTDSCRDRLAAFYHWKDRQSLDVAIAIARRRKIDLDAVHRWSKKEGALGAYAEFLALLNPRKTTPVPPRKSRLPGALRRPS